MSQTENKMKYVRLGKSGLKVSQLILGCMTYGSKESWEDWVLGEEEGIEHIKAAYDMGINTFDTADVYSQGQSEVILGKAIKKHNLPREEIVVMTKVCSFINEDHPMRLDEIRKIDRNSREWANRYGLSRKHIFEGIKGSLRRLQLDYVDVLQCHRFDPTTPIEETMQALDDVVKAGYVRYIGMSSCYAWQFHKMQNYAIQNNLTPFISMQNYYNAIYREEEREMMPLLKDLGVGCIPWSPLARGYLTRPTEKFSDTTRGKTDKYSAVVGVGVDAQSQLINKSVQEIAEKRGVTMSQVAVAWSLQKDFITGLIVGTTKVENLKQLVDGLDVTLTEEEMKSIDEPYRPVPIQGHV